jgi:hypothetical protein
LNCNDKYFQLVKSGVCVQDGINTALSRNQQQQG